VGDLRLIPLQEPLSFPLDLVWRAQTGTLRPTVDAVLATARGVRRQQDWS
jgi:hypothetical protein